MIIGKRVIIPLIWSLSFLTIVLIIIGISVSILYGYSHDLGSVIIAIGGFAVSLHLLTLAARPALLKTDFGFRVREPLKSFNVSPPSYVEFGGDSMWWGADYSAPEVHLENEEYPIILNQFAIYAFTPHGKRKMQRIVDTLNGWLRDADSAESVQAFTELTKEE